MSKSKMIISAILSVVLIAGAITGMVFLVRGIKDVGNAFGNSEGETKKLPGGTDESAEDTSSEITEPDPGFYLDSASNCGYSTIANITYFFVSLEVPADFTGTLRDNPTLTCLYPTPYSSFVVNFKYSFDGSIWNTPSTLVDEETQKDIGYFESLPNGTRKVYACYTTVTNCANPMAVLSDLKANVFFTESMFNPNFNYSVSLG